VMRNKDMRIRISAIKTSVLALAHTRSADGRRLFLGSICVVVPR